jgi:hypothetical protein
LKELKIKCGSNLLLNIQIPLFFAVAISFQSGNLFHLMSAPVKNSFKRDKHIWQGGPKQKA